MAKFGILISTKNRLADLKVTLKEIDYLINDDNVECIIYDDGSVDDTSVFIKKNYPKTHLITNIESKGYMYCRNKMLNLTKAKYAISLDDDAHIITKNPLPIIEDYFIANPLCGVLGFRLFWDIEPPDKIVSSDKSKRVKGFVGCGHAWNMEAWNSIPNYPEWFVFYGEEEFASYQLFKKQWEVHYFPDVLIHHRVNNKGRKKNKDYQLRLRRSLRSGWYLNFLFYPKNIILKKFLYSLWVQIKTKVLKGNFKALFAIIQAMFDIIINLPYLFKNTNRLTKKEFLEYSKLPDTKVYWLPKDS